MLKVHTTQEHFERGPAQQTIFYLHLRLNSAGSLFELLVPAEEARSLLLLIKMLAHVPARERVLHICSSSHSTGRSSPRWMASSFLC